MSARDSNTERRPVRTPGLMRRLKTAVNLVVNPARLGWGTDSYDVQLGGVGLGAELGEIDPADISFYLDQAMRWAGDPCGFYGIILRMGGSGSVYRQSLLTRSNALLAVEPVVVPVSEEPMDLMVAEAVTEDVLPLAVQMAPDLLRSISHGVSAVEVQWDTATVPWRPVAHQWRRPSCFRVPFLGCEYLCIVDDAGNEIDQAQGGDGRWVVMNAQGGAGLPPFVRGVAAPCMLWWLAKIQARVRWAAYVNTYGFPLRVGYYDETHSQQDLDALAATLRDMGREIGGMMPKGMDVEIKDVPGRSTTGGGAGYFADLINQANRETEIEILGQVATTEGTPGKLGNENAQDRVRRDIAEADSRALSQVTTNDLAEPYVTYRWGPDTPVPAIRWIIPDRPEDLGAWSQSLWQLIPVGLRVRAEDVWERLGLAPPDDDDEILEGSPPGETADDEDDMDTEPGDGVDDQDDDDGDDDE